MSSRCSGGVPEEQCLLDAERSCEVIAERPPVVRPLDRPARALEQPAEGVTNSSRLSG